MDSDSDSIDILRLIYEDVETGAVIDQFSALSVTPSTSTVQQPVVPVLATGSALQQQQQQPVPPQGYTAVQLNPIFQQNTMANQQGSLPTAVKIPLPEKFSGIMDHDAVMTFLFGVEQYCNLVNLTDDVQKAQLCAMLLTGDARVWFMHRDYDQSTLTYTVLSDAIKTYFRPADFAWRAREQLAQCKQRDPYNVTGYTTAFKRCVQRVPDQLPEGDLLDRYVRGLHHQIAREVLMNMPADLEEATQLAERVAAVWRFTSPKQHNRRHQPRYQGYQDASNTRQPGGYAPMNLGAARGRAPPRGRGNQARGRNSFPPPPAAPGPSGGNPALTCYNCGGIGHYARDCPSNTRDQPRGGGRGGRGRGRGRGGRANFAWGSYPEALDGPWLPDGGYPPAPPGPPPGPTPGSAGGAGGAAGAAQGN